MPQHDDDDFHKYHLLYSQEAFFSWKMSDLNHFLGATQNSSENFAQYNEKGRKVEERRQEKEKRKDYSLLFI